MKILFLSHYFHPEGNAPATRVYEMTRRWAAAGHDVTVVAAVPNVPAGIIYEGYKNKWRQEESAEGSTSFGSGHISPPMPVRLAG